MTVADCRVPELDDAVRALVRGHEALAPEPLFVIDRAGEGFRLSWRGEPYYTARAEGGLLGALEVALDHERTRLLRSRCAFHAAAAGSVFAAGASGAGKSTLAAVLVARGLPYLTDDCAFVEVDGSVAPYPRRIGIRPGALELIGPLGDRLAKLEYRAENGERAAYLVPRESPRGPARMAVVAFLERTGPALRVTPISVGESAARLVGHSLSTDSARDLERAARLASSARARVVVGGGSPTEIAAALLALLP